MRSLLELDLNQLRRIDAAIAEFEDRPAAERQKMIYLLRALEHERKELLRANPAIKAMQRLQAAA
jgi:hypothetical protein